MKTVICVFLSICIAFPVFSQESVPSVKLLFESRKKQLDNGEIFAGKVVDIEYSDADLFTDEKSVKSIKIGDKSGMLTIVIENDTPPKISIGQSVFVQVMNGVILYPDSHSGLGRGYIIEGDFKVKDSLGANEKKPTFRASLTTDDYFSDDLQYGNRNVVLTGKISEFGVAGDGNLRITLTSSEGKNIICWFDSFRWSKNQDLRAKLKTLRTDTSITVSGTFLQELSFQTLFDIKEIQKMAK